MKTVIKTSVLLFLALAFNASAQVKVKNWNTTGPKPIEMALRGGNGHNGQGNTQTSQSNNNQNSQGNWQNNNNNFGGNVTVSVGNYPYNDWGYGAPAYGYNANPYYGYSPKKAAKNTLHASKSVINEAIDIHNWHDIYSPLLAKAIRHHNFAKQMYYWGNYRAAINHAERARYIAWNSLQYFQDPGNCNNGYSPSYPDPYSDPYDPYYKKGDSGGKVQNEGGKQPMKDNTELDRSLPEPGKSDKDIIDSFDRMKEE